MGAKFGPNFLRPAPQTGLSPKPLIEIIKFKLWPAAGCEPKVAAELSSHPLQTLSNNKLRKSYLDKFYIMNFFIMITKYRLFPLLLYLYHYCGSVSPIITYNFYSQISYNCKSNVQCNQFHHKIYRFF